MTNEERAKGFAGAAILAAYITGALSLVAAVVGIFTNPILAGLPLIAAAICFTGVANAIPCCFDRTHYQLASHPDGHRHMP